MKLLIAIMLFSISLTCFAGNGFRSFVPGEVLIKFKEAVRNKQFDKSLNLKFMEKRRRGWMRFKTDDVINSIGKLKNDSRIEHAQPNYIYYLYSIPNDPYFGEQWGMQNTGQTIKLGIDAFHPLSGPATGVSGDDLNIPAAWDNGTSDCRSTVVAVIDSGANYNHEDLIDNLWDSGGLCYDADGLQIVGGCPHHGWDFEANDDDPLDENEHGTHVAGIIGARGNNGKGISGVCAQAKLMILKTAGLDGSMKLTDIENAIHFAIYNGAQVINMSLGGMASAAEPEDVVYKMALEEALWNGVNVVVAAGNSSTDVDGGVYKSYPCSFDLEGMLCVASLDADYGPSSFSNYGIVSVDVAAPGSNILSSVPGLWQYAVAGDLMTGWTVESGGSSTPWSETTCSGAKVLSLPSTWCAHGQYSESGAGGTFVESIWRDFGDAFQSYDIAKISLRWGSVMAASDTFYILNYPTNSDPYQYLMDTFGSVATGTLVSNTNGVADFLSTGATYSLERCIGNSHCSIGFSHENTNDSTVSFGSLAYALSLHGLSYENNRYRIMSGTSMATPFVTGVVAMLRSFNPDYTVMDAYEALMATGVSQASLVGKTKTEKSVDALMAVRFINTPTGFAGSIP